jgi:hypothetical protein
MAEKCDHIYDHLETVKRSRPDGWHTHYKRVDIYFCVHCLEQKETVREDWSREKPDWY